ncbi:MAG: UDP-N-acetylmuramoyl-L-alanyl-D-glutamate--2,6-diaminopimelate ligase [Acidobacteria bacterium]|nr:UDP-N-acetylmuramoyl-L-alanyl-D-glutamate--2,6-diaminopimelate ligase [Acidobacteriota bacterium]
MVKVRDIAIVVGAKAVSGNQERAVYPSISIVTNNSRRVQPGGIFVAIQGAQLDGNDFVNDATKRGAEIIISERPRPADLSQPQLKNVTWIEVEDARKALALAAAVVHGSPSQKLRLAGVTGTNGKTTTAHLVESIFNAAGVKSAIMGTIGYRIGDELVNADYTTPESPEIQDFLRRAVDSGVTHAVMEVSSIALDLHRADELEFASAAFTNLTPDHLDFHKTMDAYYAAKCKLFDGSLGRHPRHSIINLDDPRGEDLKALCKGDVLTYALDADADITTSAREFGLDGLKFTARTPFGYVEIDSAMVGRPHAYNTLCAIGIGLGLGFDRDVIAEGINRCAGVPGRFERVSTAADDITVVVDYAHTPDAITNVLGTIRAAQKSQKDKSGRIITVMGCGGDRDRTKRPMMGEEAAKLSDLVFATSDNPRSEDPLLILNDIRVGLNRFSTPFELIVDRGEAIFKAVTQAKPGDVVMIAGKGHETYQILPTGKIHFDDREVSREALEERRLLKAQVSTSRSSKNGN